MQVQDRHVNHINSRSITHYSVLYDLPQLRVWVAVTALGDESASGSSKYKEGNREGLRVSRTGLVQWKFPSFAYIGSLESIVVHSISRPI